MEIIAKNRIVQRMPGSEYAASSSRQRLRCRMPAKGDSDSKNEAVRTGAKAPPIVMPLAKRPVARARSFSGKICPSAFAAQGKTPA